MCLSPCTTSPLDPSGGQVSQPIPTVFALERVFQARESRGIEILMGASYLDLNPTNGRESDVRPEWGWPCGNATCFEGQKRQFAH